MKHRMVVLLVDALGWNLAGSATGFASGLQHRRQLRTVLGFSSGALPTLFTGRLPHEHGRFLMYQRALERTPFSGFDALRWLPAFVRDRWRMSRWLTRLVAERGVNGYYHLYDVPRWLLPEFDLAERDDIFAPGGLPQDSLWDAVETSGLEWAGRNWRTPEARNLEWLVDRVREGDEQFLFCYTADLDALLHREGSRGAGVANRLERYDALMQQLEDAARVRGETLWLYLLSDHGMVDVDVAVDVMQRLRSLNVSWPKDYLAFFDSTMARFWWRSPGARERVRAELGGIAEGQWLEDVTLEREGALFPNRAYGEDIFLLRPGALMVPSFMGRQGLAAMHGYDPEHPDMAALLYSNRPIPSDVRHLTDVRRFLEAEIHALRSEAA